VDAGSSGSDSGNGNGRRPTRSGAWFAQHGRRSRRRAEAEGRDWRLNLAATPELLAQRCRASARCATSQTVDPTRVPPRSRFSLPRCAAEFRRPLLLGLALVVLDALAGLAGPILVKTGIDNGVAAGLAAVLFGASALSTWSPRRPRSTRSARRS
jgi:ATP-binding cassette subfamily B protein